MSNIAIVTDTDSSLPPALAAHHNIYQVPINIHFGQEAFRTGIDMDDHAVFARIDQEKQLPTTSAPTPGQFAEAFEAAFQDGAKSITCFCVSSEISATYAAAVSAKSMFEDRNIEIVDTRVLSMAQGFMAIAAAEAVAAGATQQAAIAQAVALRERTQLYAALATLKYLAMSGRVGHLTAGMANLLSIKPILSTQDGKLDMLEKVRTRKKAWQRVIDLTAQGLDGQPVERLALIHVNARDDAETFLGQLRAHIQCPDDVIIADFTPGLSVHAGAGVVGVVAVAAPQA